MSELLKSEQFLQFDPIYQPNFLIMVNISVAAYHYILWQNQTKLEEKIGKKSGLDHSYSIIFARVIHHLCPHRVHFDVSHTR